MADKFNFDVFLSHNGKDKPAVENIARLLRDEYNLKAWLDKWHLVPGEAWQEGLEDALDECQTFAVFLGPSGIGPWENEEMRSAIEERVQDKNRRVIPVLLPGAPDNRDLKLPRFLRRATWVDFRSGLDDKESLYRLYCGITGQAPGDRGSSTPSKTPTTADWHLAHPYPMPPNFTGRADEQKMLDNWLADNTNRLFILRALGGFGKSALAWQWINTHVNPTEWTKLVWWSFYEGDASFEHFIEETLKYLKLEVPQSKREQVDKLLHAMQSQKVLLIMDGFERALRAYSSMSAAYQGDEEPKLDDNQLDCVDINAESFLKSVCSLPNLKSKVLMTTRLTPRAVKTRGEFILGCREEELTAIQPADAVEFFHKQKIKGTHAEIEAACAPYGYHPLSLRLLAGRILKDFEDPADIIVAQKLKIDGDIIQQKHHVLEVSYNSLQPHEGKLLSTIACFRSPVEHKTLESIAENKETLDKDLRDLVERGVLHFDEKNKKFDLHPIVRRFAYDRLTAPQRTDAHGILIIYFEAVPQPLKVEKLEDLAPVIELYHHMVRAGNLDEAWKLFRDRIWRTLYYQLGGYQMQIELLTALFLDGENNPPRLKEEAHQGHCLNELANAYSLSGQPHRAVPLFESIIRIDEKNNDRSTNAAITLGAIASGGYLPIGTLNAAERNQRQALGICKEIENEQQESIHHQELGKVLSYRGAWQEAAQELAISTKYWEKANDVQGLCLDESYRALRFLLVTRENASKVEGQKSQVENRKSKIENLKSSIQCAQRALELADDFSRTNFRLERDYVRAYWLLGSAYRANNKLTLAEENLSKALNLCRQINMVDHEADILLDLARLRYDQKKTEEAKSLVDEALLITERCGYVLQGADVNLFLAQYALEQEQDKAKAKQYAEEAKKLATCDGPPYYYKVAYEEAERFLENL
jgi:tetratricopeptide (TPR) repeat protein